MSMPSWSATKKSFCIGLVIWGFTAGFVGAQSSSPTEKQRAENAFFRGSHLLSRENMTEALPALEEAVNLDPANVKFKRVLAIAYNNYGIRLNKEGKALEGLKSFEKALGVEPDDKGIQTNFINACIQAVSAPADKLADKEKIYFLKKVLEINPKEVIAKKALAALLNNEGVTKGDSSNAQEEIKRLEDALSLDPGNLAIKKNLGIAYYNFGIAKGRSGAFEEEIDLLKKSEKLGGKDRATTQAMADALSNLAVTKGAAGDFKSQISLLKESLELSPNDVSIKKNLAGAYNNYAVKETSISFSDRSSNLENALKIDPRNQLTHSNLSSILTKEGVREYKSGQVNKAISLLEKALKHDPKNKVAQTNLAAIYHNQAITFGEKGKHDQEIQNLNKALAISPENAQIKQDLALAYNDLAVSLENKGDVKQQINLLSKAAKLAPDSKVIQENLTKAKQKESSKTTKSEPAKAPAAKKK